MQADLLRLVDDLQHAGVRIDAVGLECHYFPNFEFEAESFSKIVRSIAERKLDVYLTEIDVNDAEFPAELAVRDRMVAERYQMLLRPALADPAVKVVQTWELTDGQTWLQEQAKGKRRPRPLPFDADCQPKPAYHAIAKSLQATGG